MSPKEEIRKLNEDLWNALGILAEATKGQEDAKSATQDYLNRAASLGGKFVVERVEDAIRLIGNDTDLDHAMKEVRGSSVIHSSASQALSELEKKV